MKGAIIGDIVGSRFEFNNIKSKDFDLFATESCYTDDTVTTVATMDWLMSGEPDYAPILRKWCAMYPSPMGAYGAGFVRWLRKKDYAPYGSYGNGSAMRVAPVGFFGKNEEEVINKAQDSAEITHNHPQGIKGAVSVALAIHLLRDGKSKAAVKKRIAEDYGYDLSRTCDEIRPGYYFNETCQGTVPEAFIAFFDSTSFEDAIRNAISLGGDSDTLTCITGGLAEAHYGVPETLWEQAVTVLPQEMLEVINRFYGG